MYRLLFVLISINIFAQKSEVSSKVDPDVRNVNWGMTLSQVKEHEIVKNTIIVDTIIIDKEITQILIVPNLIINKSKAQINYSFNNNKLISVEYILKNDSLQNIDLFSNIVKVTNIYNNLVSNKKMTSLYCWSYDSDSYKQLSNGKKACSFTNKEEIKNVEQVGKENKQVSEIMYSLSNDRTISTFIFDLKSNFETTKINFIPSSKIKKQMKNSSF